MGRAEWLVERPWRPVLLVLLIVLPLLLLGELAAADTQSRARQSQRDQVQSAAQRASELVAARVGGLLAQLVGLVVTPRFKESTGLILLDPGPVVVDPADPQELSIQVGTFLASMRNDVENLVVVDGAGVVLVADPPERASGGSWVGATVTATGYYDLVANRNPRYIGVDATERRIVIAVPVAHPISGRADRRVGAVLAAFLRPDVTETWLRPLSGAVADLYIVDPQGRQLARLSGGSAGFLADLRDNAAVGAALRGGGFLGDATDPTTGNPALVATTPIGDLGWQVVAIGRADTLQAEVDAALAQQRALRFGLAGVLILGAALVGIASGTAIRRRSEIAEALRQQTAVADVLQSMSRSAFDLQAVFDVVVENATRLCRGDWGYLFRKEGDAFQLVASHGGTPALLEYERSHPTAITDRTLIGRVALRRQVVHIPDLFEDPDYDWPTNREHGVHTVLGVPIFRGDEVIGAIGAARNKRRPFSDGDIRLIQTFADQATIAMENVRLFNETKEALERQTAISAILRAIADSPDNERPVLATIAHSATAFCGAADAAILLIRDGRFRFAAHHGPVLLSSDSFTISMTKESVAGHAVVDRRTIQVADVLGPEGDAYPQAREGFPETGQRAILATPLVREGAAIGAIVLRKIEPGAFSASQVSLIEAFADQAVIAIENVRLFNETKEALERQTATSEVLKSISRAPFELQPILDTLVQNAARLTAADNADLVSFVGGRLHGEALFGETSEEYKRVLREAMDGRDYTPSRGTLVGRTLLERRPVHIVDVLEDAEYEWQESQRVGGFRTLLGVPLIRQDRPVGVIIVWRREVKPFTNSQIELLTTFADQAVIAMENVRLFNETKEALERQTATAGILEVISRSTSDLQPVLDTVVAHAERLCAADYSFVFLRGEAGFSIAAWSGGSPELVALEKTVTVQPSRQFLVGRVALEGRPVQIPDVLVDTEYGWREGQEVGGYRTMLGVPLFRAGEVAGVLGVFRNEVAPFNTEQIELLRTFADQAVIAIENVRLFNETNEALERQTATSSILNVISRSPSDQQPTLDAIVESGARLCDAEMAFIYVVEDGFFKLRAGYKVPAAFVEYTNADPVPVAPHRGSLSGRVVAERRAVQIPDVLADAEYTYLEGQRLVGYRAMLNVPMFSEGELIGLIGLWRTAPVAFTTKQVDLMSTFADQAVIAIENMRLFNETKEALEQQTAVAEVLKTISRSAFDLRPVLDIVLDNAVRIAGADIGWLSRVEAGKFATVAYSSEFPQRVRDELVRERAAGHLEGPWIPLGQRGGVMGLTLAEGRTIHVADVKDDEQLKNSVVARLSESRTVIGVPMLREGETIGGMVLARYEVRPFSDREIELVQTFADQAAIAIGNVRLFSEIQDKSQQLEIASRHKSEFLANMSHELRTPLNAIIGFSEVLLQGIFGGVNEKQREYLQDVLGSGQHLLTLINDILDLSKIEAGRMDLEVSTFEVRDALNSGLTIVRERAARHGIELSAAVASDVGTIEADERKVKQILYNLLSNAVKFTQDGGRVDVSVRAENGDIRVEVRDTGIGIAGEDQERIFEEFRQVGRERSREGTGLGLTLTKRFVELHGGRIWLESAPGKGSTFAFTLPVRRPATVSA